LALDIGYSPYYYEKITNIFKSPPLTDKASVKIVALIFNNK